MVVLRIFLISNVQNQNLENSFKEKNEILESIGDGFFAVDKNWIVTYWNNKAEELLFRKKEEKRRNAGK